MRLSIYGYDRPDRPNVARYSNAVKKKNNKKKTSRLEQREKIRKKNERQFLKSNSSLGEHFTNGMDRATEE